jgi:hypothetical protein
LKRHHPFKGKNGDPGRPDMLKPTNKHLLLFLILALSFAYRMLLMHWATFPPGADIGLHNSVVYSITRGGNTDFLWNYYQMGGGLSLTFPGYHIFVSYIILLTGMPDFLAHSLVVSFFSTLIVACAFLITRKIWGESTAFIAAFLVAISRFDIEMLLWGGYPNVITLLLIPLTFYLFLQRERFSLLPFLAATTILAGSIYLTHSLSAVMFAGTTLITVISAVVLSKKLGLPKKRFAVWLLPVFLGAVLISPFLIDAVPAYLGANSETFTGGVSGIRLALLSTRIVPLEIVLPLFFCVVFFFLFSKEYKGKYLTVPAILFTVWILVPMFFTQGYLVGIYTDYNRFLYYILFPVIVLIAMGIDHGSDFFARIINTYLSFTIEASQTARNASKFASRAKSHLTRQNIYSGFILGLLLFAFLAVPIFVTPFQGVVVQSFYQVIDDPRYEAIQWARQNTQTGSIFVSDALYGWWFSGFAQRPTLSAVDPQYLTLSREFEPAKAAKSLLDTDYVIDNGLIQVREDGGYVGRHNPMFLAKLNWTYFPYPFFNFNNGETTILVRKGSKDQFLDLTQLPVIEMYSETSSDQALISIRKGNDFLNYTESITVYKGVRFVNMSVTVESAFEDVSIYGLRFILQTKGEPIDRGNTLGFLDEGAKVLGQLIFSEKQPRIYKAGPELLYNLTGNHKENVQILVGVFSITDDPAVYRDPETKANVIDKILADNLITANDRVADLSLDVFDYRKALREWNVSYVACRDSEVIPKFAGDPAFSLVFINDEVAVFMVK